VPLCAGQRITRGAFSAFPAISAISYIRYLFTLGYMLLDGVHRAATSLCTTPFILDTCWRIHRAGPTTHIFPFHTPVLAPPSDPAAVISTDWRPRRRGPRLPPAVRLMACAMAGSGGSFRTAHPHLASFGEKYYRHYPNTYKVCMTSCMRWAGVITYLEQTSKYWHVGTHHAKTFHSTAPSTFVRFR